MSNITVLHRFGRFLLFVLIDNEASDYACQLPLEMLLMYCRRCLAQPHDVTLINAFTGIVSFTQCMTRCGLGPDDMKCCRAGVYQMFRVQPVTSRPLNHTLQTLSLRGALTILLTCTPSNEHVSGAWVFILHQWSKEQFILQSQLLGARHATTIRASHASKWMSDIFVKCSVPPWFGLWINWCMYRSEYHSIWLVAGPVGTATLTLVKAWKHVSDFPFQSGLS